MAAQNLGGLNYAKPSRINSFLSNPKTLFFKHFLQFRTCQFNLHMKFLSTDSLYLRIFTLNLQRISLPESSIWD